MLWKRLAMLMFVMGLGSATCLAQLDKASIIGTVSDATGVVVAGARVDITNLGTGAVATHMTDSSGTYAAPGLPVGSYRVTASAEGLHSTPNASNTLPGAPYKKP